VIMTYLNACMKVKVKNVWGEIVGIAHSRHPVEVLYY